jgi:hypothetical protein
MWQRIKSEGEYPENKGREINEKTEKRYSGSRKITEAASSENRTDD